MSFASKVSDNGSLETSMVDKLGKRLAMSSTTSSSIILWCSPSRENPVKLR